MNYLFVRNPLPMWIYDIGSKRFLNVNEAAVQQYGYIREEFLRMRVTDMIPVKLVQRIETGGSARSPHQHSSTLHLPHKDGGALEAEIIARDIMFGEQQSSLVVALDVTERNATEARLQRTAKLEAVGRLSGGGGSRLQQSAYRHAGEC